MQVLSPHLYILIIMSVLSLQVFTLLELAMMGFLVTGQNFMKLRYLGKSRQLCHTWLCRCNPKAICLFSRKLVMEISTTFSKFWRELMAACMQWNRAWGSCIRTQKGIYCLADVCNNTFLLLLLMNLFYQAQGFNGGSIFGCIRFVAYKYSFVILSLQGWDSHDWVSFFCFFSQGSTKT